MVTENTTSAVQQYIDDTIMLVRSLSIKSEIAAQRVNEWVISNYGEGSVDTNQPRTWKYYLNICGQYHFSDRMMKVISLDTQEEIEFTPENMRIHTATAEAYKYGTRYYFSLVRKFPDQEFLILAVTNPANMDVAVNSEDGTILAYYDKYVEPQESTLIYEIEQYIKGFIDRYTVVGFNNLWKNYPVLNLATLYTSLPAQVMNIRLAAVKTERTHSFHITQYLASHQRLDKYIPYMTLKQKLYLYHNIDYIEKYAGFNETFDELIQWILTDRFIPLSSYTVRQLQEFTEDQYPEIRARRVPVNVSVNPGIAEYLPIQSLYNKESRLQSGNEKYLSDNSLSITHKLSTDDSSVIQTKDLESSMTDYTDAVPDTLPEVLLRQWVYMSGSGLYNVAVNFNDPFTGDPISLLSKDALIYYCYIYMTSMGKEPTYVPDIVNVKYRLHPRPPVELLYRDLLKDRFLDLKDIADELVSAQPIITQCFSISAFFKLNYKIFEECQNQWKLKASIGDPLKRGIVAKMISRLFGITCLQMAPADTLMGAWLEERGLNKFEGTYQDGLKYCQTIFTAATGYIVDDTKSLRNIQKAMVEMFTQLSSYSIQVIREINDSALIPLNWAAIRVGVEGQEGADDLNITAPVRVQGVDQSSVDDVLVDDDGDHILVTRDIYVEDVTIKDRISVKVCEGEGNATYDVAIQLPRLTVSDPLSTTNQNLPFQPMHYYDELTQEQRLEIANYFLSRNQNG